MWGPGGHSGGRAWRRHVLGCGPCKVPGTHASANSVFYASERTESVAQVAARKRAGIRLDMIRFWAIVRLIWGVCPFTYLFGCKEIVMKHNAPPQNESTTQKLLQILNQRPKSSTPAEHATSVRLSLKVIMGCLYRYKRIFWVQGSEV